MENSTFLNIKVRDKFKVSNIVVSYTVAARNKKFILAYRETFNGRRNFVIDIKKGICGHFITMADITTTEGSKRVLSDFKRQSLQVDERSKGNAFETIHHIESRKR